MQIERSPQMLFGNYDLEKIVRKDHPLRKVAQVINFKHLANRFWRALKTLGRRGYGLEVGIKCVFLQFYYDLSDRQLEERLKDDISFRLFCGFKIDEETPDHSYFGRVRKLLGPDKVGRMFRLLVEKATEKEIMRQVFRFVDATAVKAKETTWEERDKAIKDGEEKLNNSNVENYSADKDARFGCKGKSKFWFGYKKHVSVDMGSGLIDKVAVTPANVPDQEGFILICPNEGMVFGDKAYCLSAAQTAMKARGCHSGAILKNNMKGKNKDKDRWLTSVRAPFEGIFSKDETRTRYRGLVKMQMQAFMEAFAFNVKRLLVIESPPLFAGA
jgi:IS5 family transposase